MTLDKPVVLIGMMGSGKSRIGLNLAQEIGVEFVDSDRRIVESAGHSISDIFTKYGEEEFRRVEKRVIANLINNEAPCVMALGGGAILSDETAALVKEKAHSVWVQAPMDHIIARVSENEERPLLACEDPRSVLQKLSEERRPYYEQADCHIMNEDGKAAYAVKQIITFLKNKQQ